MSVKNAISVCISTERDDLVTFGFRIPLLLMKQRSFFVWNTESKAIEIEMIMMMARLDTKKRIL